MRGGQNHSMMEMDSEVIWMLWIDDFFICKIESVLPPGTYQ